MYVPISQCEQNVAPSPDANCPVGQSLHLRSSKNEPAAHVIDVQFVAPAPMVKVFAAHGEQNDAPSCAVK